MQNNFLPPTPEVWTKESELSLRPQDVLPGQSQFFLCRSESAKFNRESAKKIMEDVTFDLSLQGLDVVSTNEYLGEQNNKPCWHWLILVTREDPFAGG